MKNNATIQGKLIDLLNVLDARAIVNIFVNTEGDGDPKNSYSISYLKVYEFLTEPELVRKYYNYDVIGLSLGLTTNILIKEA
jgi:hypothetical protein